MREAILILAHGSRSKLAQKEFLNLIKKLKNRNREIILEGANMELSEPSMEEAVKKIIKLNKEIRKINIIPYFLFNGIHLERDVPKLLEELNLKYNIQFILGKPLSSDDLMFELLLKKIDEVL